MNAKTEDDVFVHFSAIQAKDSNSLEEGTAAPTLSTLKKENRGPQGSKRNKLNFN